MTPNDPRHGTYAGANVHWKESSELCNPCRLAATRTRKTNQLAALAGRPGMVELGPAWNIIDTEPRNKLVAATGMPHERLRRYHLAGPTKRVHRTTRDRILAATPPTWTIVGLQRRLQALGALGWSMQALADQYGMNRDSLSRLRRRENPKHVRLNFGQQVAAIYLDLAMSLPPSGMSASETRAEAMRRGWLPPLSWNNIDDPDEKPRTRATRPLKTDIDPVVIQRVLAGDRMPTTRAEKLAITAAWEQSGRTLKDLERLMGWRSDRYTDRAAS